MFHAAHSLQPNIGPSPPQPQQQQQQQQQVIAVAYNQPATHSSLPSSVTLLPHSPQAFSAAAGAPHAHQQHQHQHQHQQQHQGMAWMDAPSGMVFHHQQPPHPHQQHQQHGGYALPAPYQVHGVHQHHQHPQPMYAPYSAPQQHPTHVMPASHEAVPPYHHHAPHHHHHHHAGSPSAGYPVALPLAPATFAQATQTFAPSDLAVPMHHPYSPSALLQPPSAVPISSDPPLPPLKPFAPSATPPPLSTASSAAHSSTSFSHHDANRAVAERRQVILKFVTDALTDAELHAVCSQFGPVDQARIVYDRATGRTRGYAFVTFVSADAAQNAVAGLTGMSLHGRHLAAAITETARKRAF